MIDRRRNTEYGIRNTEDGIQKTEDGIQKTEDGIQKTEDKRRKTAYKKKRPFFFCLPSTIYRLPGSRGFTFIEILITISVVAVLFVPVMQLFSHSMFATDDNLELITATNLAKSEMERTINLNMTKAQLKQIGNQVFPPENQAPYEINRTSWRVKRLLTENTDPLEVHIQVFKEKDPGKPVVELVTLIEDLMWGTLTPVGTGSETETEAK